MVTARTRRSALLWYGGSHAAGSAALQWVGAVGCPGVRRGVRWGKRCAAGARNGVRAQRAAAGKRVASACLARPCEQSCKTLAKLGARTPFHRPRGLCRASSRVQVLLTSRRNTIVSVQAGFIAGQPQLSLGFETRATAARMDPADTSAGLATRVTHALKLRRQPTTRYDEATKALTETANGRAKPWRPSRRRPPRPSRSRPTGTRLWRARARRRTGACPRSRAAGQVVRGVRALDPRATASGAARGPWPCL